MHEVQSGFCTTSVFRVSPNLPDKVGPARRNIITSPVGIEAGTTIFRITVIPLTNRRNSFLHKNISCHEAVLRNLDTKLKIILSKYVSFKEERFVLVYS